MRLICGSCGSPAVKEANLNEGDLDNNYYKCGNPACKEETTVPEWAFSFYAAAKEKKNRPLEKDPGPNRFLEAQTRRARRIKKEIELLDAIEAEKEKGRYQLVVTLEKIKYAGRDFNKITESQLPEKLQKQPSTQRLTRRELGELTIKQLECSYLLTEDVGKTLGLSVEEMIDLIVQHPNRKHWKVRNYFIDWPEKEPVTVGELNFF